MMALQLTGAAKASSVANLQLRMPIAVIGGGLTAIDTATESLAYYIVQVEKFLERYETLVAEKDEREVRAQWSPEEIETAGEFIAHARAIRSERQTAAAEGREPNLVRLMHAWGGVTIAYRRHMIDSPSYTLNHEEVAKALEEGIRFAESLTPDAVEVDRYGHAAALLLTTRGGESVRMAAKSILVAAGTQPNTVLGREDPHNVFLDGKWFQAVDENGVPVRPERVAKPAASRVLMSLRADGRAISFFGDLHPSYAGNVVKAMASAKQGYPVVSRILARRAPSVPNPVVLLEKMNNELRAVVHDVVRLTPTIVEVVVKAPMAARAFKPGQFYRLQNYESFAARSNGTVLAMEGLALTGASVDREKGLLSTIVLEMGGSSDLCALLKPGEPCILMGPTGTPTETPAQETVLLIGGGLGNAVLFSIGQQLRARGSRTIYFAGYKKIIDRYKVEEIEKAADVVVWCCDEAPGFTPGRVQDKAFVGNIVEAILAYGQGNLGGIRTDDGDDPEISLHAVDRLVVIGSDAMMGAVARARHTSLAPFLKPDHKAIGSINSPMQCMMKEICAQCLQQHKDPVTGEETVVFSCFNQDQALDHVDWGNLRTRLSQNGVQEKLTKQWIDRCLRGNGAREEVAVNKRPTMRRGPPGLQPRVISALGFVLFRFHRDHFNLHQRSRRRQRRHLHGAPGWLVRLILSSEILSVRRVQSREVHLPFVLGIARQVHMHHHHVGHGQPLVLQDSFDLAERARRLRLGIAIIRGRSLRAIRGRHRSRQLSADVKRVAGPYRLRDRRVAGLDVFHCYAALRESNGAESHGHHHCIHRFSQVHLEFSLSLTYVTTCVAKLIPPHRSYQRNHPRIARSCNVVSACHPAETAPSCQSG
jgi:NAD(P)H-flavin reductase